MANASQGKIRKLLERDFGFSMKETPSENESEEEINFAFKIKSDQRKITKQEQKLIENAKQLEVDKRIPGQVKKAKRRIEEQKNHDKKMNCKEKIAQILAYLPHLVALNGTYTIVQTKIEIPQLLGKELANLGNERLGKLDPNSKDSKYVLTLFPLNTNDDGLPIKDWYEKNFDLIRKLISDDGQGNQNLNKILAPQDQSYLLFKDNALPREYPLVHIAAMLDAGKESTEIKKQLLEYYPSLRLLNSSLILDHHVEPASQAAIDQAIAEKEAAEIALAQAQAEKEELLAKLELLKSRSNDNKNTESDDRKNLGDK